MANKVVRVKCVLYTLCQSLTSEIAMQISLFCAWYLEISAQDTSWKFLIDSIQNFTQDVNVF